MHTIRERRFVTRVSVRPAGCEVPTLCVECVRGCVAAAADPLLGLLECGDYIPWVFVNSWMLKGLGKGDVCGWGGIRGYVCMWGEDMCVCGLGECVYVWGYGMCVR